MQLRTDETAHPILLSDMFANLADQETNPVSSDINNLIYTLRLYDTMHNYLRSDYINTDNNVTDNRFIILTFEKTINLISQMISKTYSYESIEYTDYTKILIVKTMYKLNEVLLTLRYLLSRMEYESDYISAFLQISIDKKREKILDKKSIEARVYYCYRYLYKSQEENNYNISSYADGKYTEVEIYDHYFKENASNDENDDLLIKEDYKKWFVCEETTDRYDIVAYDKLETTEDTHLLTMCELKELIDFHKNELEKYKNIMHKRL
jgi:hypothetical protein